MTDENPDPDRRWRRALVTYPREYRRVRGEEIIDTMRAGGRSRPGVRQMVNVLRHGLRARLGRPDSRAVVWISLLAALGMGMVAAIGADRLAWQTAGRLPSNAQATRLLHAAVPGQLAAVTTSRRDALFDTDSNPASVEVEAHRPAVTGLPGYARTIRDRLRAGGWQPGAPVIDWTSGCFGGWWGTSCGADDWRSSLAFTARRGQQVVQVELTRRRKGGQTPAVDGTVLSVRIGIYHRTPTLVPVAAVAGGLLAAIAGWLLFARVSRRSHRRLPAARVGTYLLGGATGAFWLGPALIVLCGSIVSALNILFADVGFFYRNDRWIPSDLASLTVGPYWVPEVLGALSLLGVVALSLTPDRWLNPRVAR